MPQERLTLAEQFVQALGTNNPELLDAIYHPEVILYTPLGWPIRGLAAVKEFVGQFHAAYPGLRVTLHDQFSSADGERVCFRFVIHFHNTGPFYGNPPTGERGTMSETHAVRLRDDKIVEQFVGDNNFAMHLPRTSRLEDGLPPRHPRSQPCNRRSKCPRQAFANLAVPPTSGAAFSRELSTPRSSMSSYPTPGQCARHMHGWILDLFFELVLINRFQRQMHPVVASGD
jgi:SnoaL-like domain